MRRRVRLLVAGLVAISIGATAWWAWPRSELAALSGHSPVNVLHRPSVRGVPLEIKTYSFQSDYKALVEQLQKELMEKEGRVTIGMTVSSTRFFRRDSAKGRTSPWVFVDVYRDVRRTGASPASPARGWVVVNVYRWGHPSMLERFLSWLS